MSQIPAMVRWTGTFGFHSEKQENVIVISFKFEV